MNNFYRLFIYNAFKEPGKNYILRYKNNKYSHNVTKRYESKKSVKKNVQKFNIYLNNDFKDFFRVNTKKMTSVNGSRFSSKYDPLCNTALQIINKKYVNLKDLYLYKYLKKFNPKNLSEVFLINKKNKLDNLNPYNRFYPWHTPYPPPENQDFFFGPKVNYLDEIKFRVHRLKNIFKLVKKYGYIPDENDCIDGYILKNKNDYRFVVTAGHHRASVLCAMNILGKFPNDVIVRFDQHRITNKLFIIHKKNVKNWPSVKNNFLSKKDAILVFDSFFKEKNYYKKY